MDLRDLTRVAYKREMLLFPNVGWSDLKPSINQPPVFVCLCVCVEGRGGRLIQYLK